MILPSTEPVNRRAIWILRDRNLQPVIAADRHCCPHVVPSVALIRRCRLPCAGKSDVAEAALHGGECDRSARLARRATSGRSPWPCHRLGQDERGDIADLAVRIFAEFNVLYELVERIARIELAKCAPGDLLVLTGIAERSACSALQKAGERVSSTTIL